MDYDIKELENIIKLLEKYKLQEISLPNGLKLVKSLHLPPKTRAPKKSNKNKVPINEQPMNDELLYAASKAGKVSDFTRFRANIILPKASES